MGRRDAVRFPSSTSTRLAGSPLFHGNTAVLGITVSAGLTYLRLSACLLGTRINIDASRMVSQLLHVTFQVFQFWRDEIARPQFGQVTSTLPMN